MMIQVLAVVLNGDAAASEHLNSSSSTYLLEIHLKKKKVGRMKTSVAGTVREMNLCMH